MFSYRLLLNLLLSKPLLPSLGYKLGGAQKNHLTEKF